MAYNSYTWHIQVIVKKDAVLPKALKARWDTITAGEAQNKVELANGDVFIKDWLMGKENFQEIEDLVDAKRADLVIIKTSKDMAAYLKDAPLAVEL